MTSISGRVEGGGRGSGLIIFFHIIVEMVGHNKSIQRTLKGVFAKNEMGNRLTAINNRFWSRTLPLSIDPIYFFCDFNKILIWNCRSSKTSYRVKKKLYFFNQSFLFFLNIFSIFIVLIVKHYNTQMSHAKTTIFILYDWILKHLLLTGEPTYKHLHMCNTCKTIHC